MSKLSKSNLEAALAYARWLHRVEFIKWQNTYRREMGLPIEAPPILLNSVGKRVYEELRWMLKQRDNRNGALPLLEAERKAVVAEIIRQMEGGM